MESKYMTENCEIEQVCWGFNLMPGWYCVYSQTGLGQWNWEELDGEGCRSRTWPQWALSPLPYFTDNIRCVVNSKQTGYKKKYVTSVIRVCSAVCWIGIQREAIVWDLLVFVLMHWIMQMLKGVSICPYVRHKLSRYSNQILGMTYIIA